MGKAPRPRRVGIIGLGVLGGSLACSLKKSGASPHITGYSVDPGDRSEAKRVGAIDAEAISAVECATGQDLVIYAVPLEATIELLQAHLEHWGDAVVTDVASLKAPVMAAIRGLDGAERFVGSHPMAGSEGSGFSHSSAHLFEGAPVWLTGLGSDPDASETVTSLWESVGAVPRAIEPEEHDTRMVWVSHVPQITANALAHALLSAGFSTDELGPGARGMTRLAGSSPEMWEGILASAAPADATALRAVAAELEQIAANLDAGKLSSVTTLMRKTRIWREGP